jgi:hypothetical protein
MTGRGPICGAIKRRTVGRIEIAGRAPLIICYASLLSSRPLHDPSHPANRNQ